ncbi:4-hydroxy-tetrahydrodipicolinate synthase [Paenibacillus rhizovicinus]|uniref:4-hydroxy-tetrahydrodipicolinate synthase n=1 Tax=Paenibacillus rhizovicinus TaxID=2704463 RepID=A0A6C0P0Y3_9BACL|nr:4-hydroxy-tetrahydrodipicolinate synthase [Paenibacillus rhizovicinus]QHW32041.1 4-hydroxy-tetrahydrodipicolinate synthase [Paenibacillus rhizovicinus]
MLKEADLRGIFVPVATPFSADESLDEASFDRYLRHLLAHDIQGLVINGTTGESPTVSWDEVERLVALAKAVMAAMHRQVPIIVGTGTNDTRTTVRRTELAGRLGADAALVVVPYYSKPPQSGIAEHFRRASETGLPVIAYEVPSRTGVRLQPDTAAAILELNGIIGMKDSSGGIELISAVTTLSGKPVLCGEDADFYAMLRQGASGGMLASANLRTDAFIGMYRQFRAGDTGQARRTFDALLPLIRLMFEESNPAPLKWLLAGQGLIASDTLRSPLQPITVGLQAKLEEALREAY